MSTGDLTISLRKWLRARSLAPYGFVLPFVVLFLAFTLVPAAGSLALAFQKANGPKGLGFVGLDHFRFLVQDPLFGLALLNTLAFTVTFLLIQIPLALGLAVLLNSNGVRAKSLFRFAFFSTHLVGSVFVAVIFKVLLAPRHGLVNRLLGFFFPFIGTQTNWMENAWTAMPAVILAALWLSVGYAMVFFLAALQGVDTELYEAAQADGAGRWQLFWHVTLPGIRPVLVFLIMTGTIAGFQLFELPYVLFQGPGPRYSVMTIGMLLFSQAFEVGDMGYASAIGWALAAMILAISLFQARALGFQLLRRREP